MARPCIVCAHPERVAIEARVAAGEPLRVIAPGYGVSHSALSRHNRAHRSPELLQVVVPLAEVRGTLPVPAAASLPDLRAHANQLIAEAVAAQRTPEEYLALAAHLTLRAGATAERPGSISDMLSVTRALRQQAVAIAEVEATAERRQSAYVNECLARLASIMCDAPEHKRAAAKDAGLPEDWDDEL